ncbi:hypothetical protein BV898_11350 [Hypsibius exemplaris]|uniref:Uncharacterized protein n=1 Tax=Hypsibius exemplaris TaxID=2072580 RepID=A0A1W0WH31_HYPEX|nr:hypothetical protein BV898_11350 [Hypsibius exemplaris]
MTRRNERCGNYPGNGCERYANLSSASCKSSFCRFIFAAGTTFSETILHELCLWFDTNPPSDRVSFSSALPLAIWLLLSFLIELLCKYLWRRHWTVLPSNVGEIFDALTSKTHSVRKSVETTPRKISLTATWRSVPKQNTSTSGWSDRWTGLTGQLFKTADATELFTSS